MSYKEDKENRVHRLLEEKAEIVTYIGDDEEDEGEDERREVVRYQGRVKIIPRNHKFERHLQVMRKRYQICRTKSDENW